MTINNLEYLALSFDRVGIRDSHKRLQGLIVEVAVDPLKQYQQALEGDFDTIEEIVRKRVAGVIAYWCQNKHNPVKPAPDDPLSEITNVASKRDDETLADFYIEQVKDALHLLAPTFNYDVPIAYLADTDELEFALLVVEEKLALDGVVPVIRETDADEAYEDDDQPQSNSDPQNRLNGLRRILQTQEAVRAEDQTAPPPVREKSHQAAPKQPEKDIVLTDQANITQSPPSEINVDVLNVSAEDAWNLVYGLMGYTSDYIQAKMLPRWQAYPDTFQKDRRFLYNVFTQALRNAAAVQYVSGNQRFSDRNMTVDQLWNHYYSDLSQNVGPQLSVAQLQASTDATWYKRTFDWLRKNIRRVNPIWLLALMIALAFDALTTYVSLDQTPMEGSIVLVFTVLITALFQIADVLVINYRKREFEADALIAKYRAKVEQLSQTIDGLNLTSDSYVQLSMERSQAHADWKAAEDNRKMARRGRYWSARIADINVAVTAYGFAFLFLNAEEPMYAVYQQFEAIFLLQAWEQVNLWVFLMVGLAVTVSFVVNTAQRTEILGWSMNRLKNSA